MRGIGFSLLIWAIVLGVIVLPVLYGMGMVILAGFGHLPALGAEGPSLAPWVALLDQPALWHSIFFSLRTGVIGTGLSLLIALPLGMIGARSMGRGARVLAPYLAIPHVALAIGLAFVLTPSGWIARLIAWPLGVRTPPDIISLGDPFGLSLILGLMMKEVPFLTLMVMSAMARLPLAAQMKAARSLGYGAASVMAKILFPQIWPLIRLPFLVALAYGLSVVDMALILGPNNPPSFAVMVLRLFAQPDLTHLMPAAAGACAQLLLVLVCFAAVWLAERGIAHFGAAWVARGYRAERGVSLWPMAARGAAVLGLALGAGAVLALGLWSITWRWVWPNILPESLSLANWQNGSWGGPLATSLALALGATSLSLALATLWLEAQDRHKSKSPKAVALIVYLPLIVPQISFLYGVNAGFLRIGLSGDWGAVIWGHILFVFPYVMIALWGPWQAQDRRLIQTAAALGAGPMARFFRVKLPSLIVPLAVAGAVGIAVSVAQFLPTLFLGAGRIQSLTTEAVALASGADRRILALHAILQAMVPLAAFALALSLPNIALRHRRGLWGNIR